VLVCVLVTRVSLAKTTEPIEMPLGGAGSHMGHVTVNYKRSLIKQTLMRTCFVGEVTQSTNSRLLPDVYRLLNKSVDSLLALAYISYE